MAKIPNYNEKQLFKFCLSFLWPKRSTCLRMEKHIALARKSVSKSYLMNLRNTTCKLFDPHRYLQNDQPLTVEFLLELFRRCVMNDEEAMQYERDTWGSGHHDGPNFRASPPATGFRKRHYWMFCGMLC